MGDRQHVDNDDGVDPDLARKRRRRKAPTPSDGLPGRRTEDKPFFLEAGNVEGRRLGCSARSLEAAIDRGESTDGTFHLLYANGERKECSRERTDQTCGTARSVGMLTGHYPPGRRRSGSEVPVRGRVQTVRGSRLTGRRRSDGTEEYSLQKRRLGEGRPEPSFNCNERTGSIGSRQDRIASVVRGKGAATGQEPR